MVAINPALDPAQAPQGPRGRALPDQGSRFWSAYQAVARSRLTKSDRLLAFEVVAFAMLGAPGHERLFASRATLAERAGVELSTVRRFLARMVRLGFLVPDPKGPPHGAKTVSPTRYLVRFEALQLADWAAEDAARSVHHEQTRSVHHAPQGLEASGRRKNTHASPPKAPKGAHAPEGTEGKKINPSAAARHAGNRAVAEGLRSDASPFHSACAALADVGVDTLVVERLVQALGPEQASDVAAKVKRKRNTRNGGALVVAIVKAEYPEAWARFEASKPRGGSRGDRKRSGEVFDPGPLDLGEGLRGTAVLPVLHRGGVSVGGAVPSSGAASAISAEALAVRLECTLQCSPGQARKAVEGLTLAGAGLPWICARIDRSAGSTEKPWDWARSAKVAWLEQAERERGC